VWLNHDGRLVQPTLSAPSTEVEACEWNACKRRHADSRHLLALASL